jgi:SAM-dependent methyltransferase
MRPDPVKLFRAAWLRLPRPGRRDCVICGHRCGGFLPYRTGWSGSPRAMRALDVVGSDLGNFECPWCGSHDRERHLMMYLQATGLWSRIPGLSILHFAPERRLAPRLLAQGPVRYVRADLYPAGPDIIRMDIHAIPEDDRSFDLVIANHVLEHVDDEVRAVAEIARVLRPGGHAVLQVPYSPRLTRTFSDPGIDSEAARLECYGQEDHVRLFGRDVFARFAAAGGLEDLSASHGELLPDRDAYRWGVNPAEPFFLFRKPGAEAASASPS